MTSLSEKWLEDLLVRLMPECEDTIQYFVPHLRWARERYALTTPVRFAAFLAQAGHESVRFNVLSETMNFSVKGLLRVYPTYFTIEQAQSYAHQPARIASRVYAGKYGNGDESSKDGWRFRGRGLFPNILIGRAMYIRVSEHLYDGDASRLIAEPWQLARPQAAVLSAGWVWQEIVGGNRYADADEEGAFRKLTKRINGGLQGIQDRLDLYRQAKALLASESLPLHPLIPEAAG